MFRKSYFPDFMIIGAQKSGTSTLHFLLSQHPDLTGSKPKEIHYFDKLPEERKSLEWYKKHFSKSVFEKRRLFFESTPNYIYYGHIPAELAALNPSMKFIIMLDRQHCQPEQYGPGRNPFHPVWLTKASNSGQASSQIESEYSGI